MKNLKTYLQFFEDGTAAVNASTTAGMGAVTNAVVGSIPGVPNGAPGSDATFTLGGVATKQPVGGPAEVSDARFLKKEKTNKINDSKKKKKEEEEEEE
jgi:hypothetical protein